MPDFKQVAQQVTEDEKGFTIPEILQRNGKPYMASDGKTKSTLTVIGSESQRYRSNRDAIWRREADAETEQTPERAAAVRSEVAAGAVTEWTGWGSNGVEPPCTPENVSVLLSVEHILLQAEANIGRRSGFFTDGSSG